VAAFGDIGSGQDIPVRLHRENVLEDVFGNRQTLEAAFAVFKAEGRGVLVYLQEGATGVPASQHSEKTGSAAQRQQTQAAQLAQLTQQLQPHFLFNALNTIAATIHTAPERADSLLTRLAALLRATADLTRRPQCTLDEELGLLDGYAAIMCERFADRVTLRQEIDDAARACRVPTLSIQPLLENAFRHGVERCSGRTDLVVRAVCRDARLRIEVEQSQGSVPAAPTHGVGLDTLRQRLAALYGARASFGLESLTPGGALAWFELPCER